MSRREDAVERGLRAIEEENVNGRPTGKKGGDGMMGEFMNKRNDLRAAPISENPRTREYQAQTGGPEVSVSEVDTGGVCVRAHVCVCVCGCVKKGLPRRHLC